VQTGLIIAEYNTAQPKKKPKSTLP